MTQKRLHCFPSCGGLRKGCLGIMKTETKKRIMYECKIPLQEWEKK